MTDLARIQNPNDSAMDQLCQVLADRAGSLDATGDWPVEQLQLCAKAGVYRWFLDPEHGGYGWGEADLMRGYLRLSAACLTTAFVITQATGALRRIAASAGGELRERLLPPLLTGETFTTLGISHLTTSRRHLARVALRAEETEAGYRLEGFSPWVTGGMHADWIVTGAQLEDGRQILIVLPTDLPSVEFDEPQSLVALTASHTGAVQIRGAELNEQWLLAGPVENVVASATGASTGGLQTSALAIGMTDRAIELVETESEKRSELLEPAAALRREQERLQADLLLLAAGEQTCTSEDLRAGANSLALRAAQASLAAAKGTGYVQGHAAGRWCREALFFLVWSCPAPVMASNLCELAGISD